MKLWFCDEEPSEADKIEKTLSTMILAQSYHDKNFIAYSWLIQTLKQAEKNHELSVWNSQQCPLGTAALPEVRANTEKAGKDVKNQPRNSLS